MNVSMREIKKSARSRARVARITRRCGRDAAHSAHALAGGPGRRGDGSGGAGGLGARRRAGSRAAGAPRARARLRRRRARDAVGGTTGRRAAQRARRRAGVLLRERARDRDRHRVLPRRLLQHGRRRRGQVRCASRPGACPCTYAYASARLLTHQPSYAHVRARRHTVCIVATAEFLAFSASVGNPLHAPVKEYMVRWSRRLPVRQWQKRAQAPQAESTSAKFIVRV